MLDLAGLPRSAFAAALQHNLERFRSLPKVSDHFLTAVATHLRADAAWRLRTLRENRPVSEEYQFGEPRFRDEGLVGRFLRQERPEVPRNLLLAPVRVNGRIEALVGVERHETDFDRGQGWSLNRLASILARDLTRREEERLTRVLDSIKEKVVSELRPGTSPIRSWMVCTSSFTTTTPPLFSSTIRESGRCGWRPTRSPGPRRRALSSATRSRSARRWRERSDTRHRS